MRWNTRPLLAGPPFSSVWPTNQWPLINGSYSFVTDTPDFWRRAHANTLRTATVSRANRPTFKHVIGAAEALMEALERQPPQITIGPFSTNPTPNFRSAWRNSWVLQPEQITPGLLSPRIGNTYSGSTMIGLTAILDIAEPGDRILMVSYGSGAGSDAFDIEVTEQAAPRCVTGPPQPKPTSAAAPKLITQLIRGSGINLKTS